MTTPLANSSIAILIANGFEEDQITAVQRILTKEKLPYKVIAPEQGLVNGWQNNSWGHYFTVDEQIGSAMGSDYEVLVLIGGSRGVEKLKTNPHTRRIINHFLEAGKPVAALGEAAALLAMSPKSAGLTVSCSDEDLKPLEEAEMVLSPEGHHLDGVVLTSNGTDMESWVAGLVELISTSANQDLQAA